MSAGLAEITLYDLGNTKQICFSPNVWKIRLLLNYKNIPYETVFVEFPDIGPTFKSFGIPPNEQGTEYTVPVIRLNTTGKMIMDSESIAETLEAMYPTPTLSLDAPERSEMEKKTTQAIRPIVMRLLLIKETKILDERTTKYYLKSREQRFGKPLTEPTPEEVEEAWSEAKEPLEDIVRLLNGRGGPFLLGTKCSYADFFLIGVMEMAKILDTACFERFRSFHPAIKHLYDASMPLMVRKD